MQKTLLTTLLVIISYILCYSQEEGNYMLIIGSDSLQIDLEKELIYKSNSGEELPIKLVQSRLQTYSNDMISFKYDKSLSVSNAVLEEGIEQCMIIKSTGTGFMVQTYSTMDPSLLTQLMLNEIVKESVSYGYDKVEEDFEKKLISGQTIKGKTATLSYKGEQEIYTVASYGAKDEGIIVVTMEFSDEFDNDIDIINIFLDSLEINN